MTRQYIGARYVPVFYNDGHGGNEWTNTVPFEPLTIVTHLGNSYTSKKQVPIDIDITNSEYWALTGAYNAQVEEYRQIVESVTDATNVIENGYVATKNFDDVQDAVEFAHDNNINIIILTEDRTINTPICLYDNMTFDGCCHVLNTSNDFNSSRIITNYDGYITINNIYQKFNSDSMQNGNKNITVKNIVIANNWHQSYDGSTNPYPRGPLAFDSVVGLTIENVTNRKLLDEVTIWTARCSNIDISKCNIESTLDIAGGCIWIYGESVESTSSAFDNINIHECICKSSKDEPVYIGTSYGTMKNINVYDNTIYGLGDLALTLFASNENMVKDVNIHNNTIQGGYIKIANTIDFMDISNNLFHSTTSVTLGVYTHVVKTSAKGNTVNVHDNMFKAGSTVKGFFVDIRYFNNVTISNNTIEVANSIYAGITVRNSDYIVIDGNRCDGSRFVYLEGAHNTPYKISNNIVRGNGTSSAIELGASTPKLLSVINNLFTDFECAIANEPGGVFESNNFSYNITENCDCLFKLTAVLSQSALNYKTLMKGNTMYNGTLYIDSIGSGTIDGASRIVKIDNYKYIPDGTSTPTWTESN